MNLQARTATRRGLAGKLLRFAITAALVALLLKLVDLGDVGRILASADPGLLFLALLVAFADRLLMVAKWYPLIRAQTRLVGLVQATRAYLAAGVANLFLPVGVGADVLRVLALGHPQGLVVELGASVVAERLLGFLASGILAIIALWVAAQASIDLTFLTPWAFGAFLAAILAVVLPYASRLWAPLSRLMLRYRDNRWVGKLVTFGSAIAVYRNHVSTILSVALLSVLEQLLPVLALAIIAQALGTPITISMLIVAVPLTLFVSRLPITFWGLGVSEGALVYILGLFGISAAEGLSLALAGRAVELGATLPGAVFWADLTKALQRRQGGDTQLKVVRE